MAAAMGIVQSYTGNNYQLAVDGELIIIITKSRAKSLQLMIRTLLVKRRATTKTPKFNPTNFNHVRHNFGLMPNFYQL